MGTDGHLVELPVLVLSAVAPEHLERVLGSPNVVGHLQKPVDPFVLADVVADLLRTIRAGRIQPLSAR